MRIFVSWDVPILEIPLETLDRDSTVLVHLNDEFRLLETSYKTASFFETLPTRIGYDSNQIVRGLQSLL